MTYGNFSPGSSGFTSFPNARYYDLYDYSYGSAYDHIQGRIGDATKETLKTFNDKNGGWYSDYAWLPNSTSPWILRGGKMNQTTKAGIFNFSSSTGDGGEVTFRAVLSAQDGNSNTLTGN